MFIVAPFAHVKHLFVLTLKSTRTKDPSQGQTYQLYTFASNKINSCTGFLKILVVSIGKWSAAGKALRVKRIQRNSGFTAKSEFSLRKTTDGVKHKNLGHWWNAWRTSAHDGWRWRIRETVTSTFSLKIFLMNERMENDYF